MVALQCQADAGHIRIRAQVKLQRERVKRAWASEWGGGLADRHAAGIATPRKPAQVAALLLPPCHIMQTATVLHCPHDARPAIPQHDQPRTWMGPGERAQSVAAHWPRQAAKALKAGPSRSTSAFLITGLSLRGMGSRVVILV